MKYIFVAISIISIWVAITLLVVNLEYTGLLLPMVALALTIILFLIGFSEKK